MHEPEDRVRAREFALEAPGRSPGAAARRPGGPTLALDDSAGARRLGLEVPEDEEAKGS